MRPVHSAISVYAYRPWGLLSDSADDRYFSSNLNLSNCYDLVQSKALFKNAADIDGFDIASLDILKIRASLAADDVIGRSGVLAPLKQSCRHGGYLIVAIGGNSVGKSKVMKHIAKWTSMKEVKNPMISKNCVTVPTFNLMLDGKVNGDEHVHVAFCNELKKLNVCVDKLQPDRQSLNRHYVPHLLTPLLEALIESEEAALTTLIIDDADRFFTPPAAQEFLRTGQSSPAWEVQRRQILKTLDIFVAFSKQDGAISLVFCTSDSTFPMKLNELGFPSHRYINEYVVIGELSPAEAVDTVKSWGVGDNLAEALVDVYGGHLARICDALEEISRKQSQVGFWDGKITFGQTDVASVISCVEEARTVGSDLEARVMSTLKTLAVTGFVQTSPHFFSVYDLPKDGHNSWLPRFLRRPDETELEIQVVALLTRHKIASYVPRPATIESLPYNRTDGIVPDTQSVRMLLVREFGKKWMEEEEKEENWWN